MEAISRDLTIALQDFGIVNIGLLRQPVKPVTFTVQLFCWSTFLVNGIVSKNFFSLFPFSFFCRMTSSVQQKRDHLLTSKSHNGTHPLST